MQQRELSPSELESMVPEGEVESRIDAVRAIMEERNLDAVVITSNNNVAYLSNLLTKGGGFKAVVLTRSGQATLFVIRMESGNAHFTVPASAGYEIIPVPVYFPDVTEILGRKVFRKISEIGRPVDMVNVFRRPGDIPPHVDDIIAAKPKSVWFQLGIRNDEAARKLAEAGIKVIQDRCLMVEQGRL